MQTHEVDLIREGKLIGYETTAVRKFGRGGPEGVENGRNRRQIDSDIDEHQSIN